MSRDATRHETPTRREYVTYGGAVVGSGLLTGCVGDSEDELNGGLNTGGGGEGSYTVSMSPVGELEFERIPESAMVYSPQYADMLVAYGHEGAINSINFPENFYTGFYEELEGVDFDPMDVPAVFNQDAGAVDKEFLYELDSDIHLIDPHWLATFDGWDWDDVEEIERNVAPFFGNRYSRENDFDGDDRLDAEGYEYYTAWELYGKVAEAFRAEERWAALREIHEAMLAEIESGLPPEGERPSVGLVLYSDGEFNAYSLLQPGFGQANYHPLAPVDVFADSDRHYSADYDATYDVESMLEIDPDILIQFASLDDPERAAELESLVDDPLGRQLTAVENDRLYPGGTAFQGPIFNLFQLEMAAKQIYPEEFGEFTGVGETPEDEQLFDRQDLADVINGGA